MVLSIGFIISVVALHSEYNHNRGIPRRKDPYESEGIAPEIIVLTRETQFWPRSPRGSLRKREKREVRRRRFKEHGVGMIFLFGISIYNPFSYFHWRDWQAACIILLHVAWPHTRAEQIGFRLLVLQCQDLGLLATFSGHMQAQLRLRHKAARLLHRGDEWMREFTWLGGKITSEIGARPQSLVVAL
jgi:hypothetical protein